MELYRWNRQKPTLSYELAPVSARPLREHLDRCKDEKVLIHEMKTFLQLDPKLGSELLKELAPEELDMKVLSTRRRPGKKYIEFSVDPKGEFTPDPKDEEEKELSAAEIEEMKEEYTARAENFDPEPCDDMAQAITERPAQ